MSSAFPWPAGAGDRRKRALMLHAPRTGGSAIRAAFDLIDHFKHLTLEEHRRRGHLDDAFTIAFTRNPYTRSESLFRWAFRRERYRDEISTDRFAAWLEQGCPRADGRPALLYSGFSFAVHIAAPQVKFLGTDHDFRGRYETLHEDVGRLALEVGAWWAELPRKDRSHIEPLHDEETRAMVRELYAIDFETYGYEA